MLSCLQRQVSVGLQSLHTQLNQLSDSFFSLKGEIFRKESMARKVNIEVCTNLELYCQQSLITVRMQGSTVFQTQQIQRSSSVVSQTSPQDSSISLQSEGTKGTDSSFTLCSVHIALYTTFCQGPSEQVTSLHTYMYDI